LAVGFVGGTSHAQQYNVTECGPGGWVSSRAYDINDAGVIVGGGLNNVAQTRAFSRAPGIGAVTLPTQLATAYGINAAGVIAGQGPTGMSWVLDGVTLTEVPSLDGTSQSVFAWDINDAGSVCGAARQDDPPSTQKAFLWTGGTPTDLGDLGGNASVAYGMNDAGMIVGTARFTDTQLRAFVFEGSTMTDLSGAAGGAAYAVNEDGLIVGTMGGEAFMSDGTTSTSLGSLGDPASGTAWGVNDIGIIVGESNERAFVYRAGGLVDLNELIDAGSGWQLLVARAINNHGDIVGYGTLNGRTKAFLLTPTCTADFNQDGQLDFFDYLDFAIGFSEDSLLADFNRDGQIDFFDYLDFAQAFAAGCE
jgi:probable HAF family extracellular repeat protein